jgi:colanic acid biosynthesis glycosyl transferase WcaI
VSEVPAPGAFRAKNGFAAENFLAVYAGNLGVKQGLTILLEAAELVASDKNIRIILCGDGAERLALEQEVMQRRLDNVSMLPLKFGRDYQELLVDGDIALITQQSGSGNAFFPSKLLVTLAHARAVVTVADDESALAQAVKSGGFGINIRPGNAKELAEALRDLARRRSDLEEWGRAGRRYVGQFEQTLVMEKFAGELASLVSAS